MIHVCQSEQYVGSILVLYSHEKMRSAYPKVGYPCCINYSLSLIGQQCQCVSHNITNPHHEMSHSSLQVRLHMKKRTFLLYVVIKSLTLMVILGLGNPPQDAPCRKSELCKKKKLVSKASLGIVFIFQGFYGVFHRIRRTLKIENKDT